MFQGQHRGSGRFDGVVRFAAGLVVGASLSCALASAAQIARHDGAFWKKLGSQDKVAYVDGYADAMHTSAGKLDQLKIAAALFHWKGADKILKQAQRGLEVSNLPARDLVAYLDGIYSSSQYGDFDVTNAIELAAMRGIDTQTAAQTAPVPAPDTSATVP